MKERRIVFINQASKVNSNQFVELAQLEPHNFPELDPEIRLSYLFMHYLNYIKNSTDEIRKPNFWFIEDNPEKIIKAGQNIHEILEKHKNFEEDLTMSLQEYQKDFFRSLTLVKLEAEVHSDRIDIATGIRVLHLKKGETAFPIHPTPNS